MHWYIYSLYRGENSRNILILDENFLNTCGDSCWWHIWCCWMTVLDPDGYFCGPSRKLGTSTTICVPKEGLEPDWWLTFWNLAVELLTRLFEILKDSLAFFMLSSRFSPKRYFESEVSLSHSIWMFSFKTGFKRSLRSADICVRPAHQSNWINSVTHTRPKVSWSAFFLCQYCFISYFKDCWCSKS